MLLRVRSAAVDHSTPVTRPDSSVTYRLIRGVQEHELVTEDVLHDGRSRSTGTSEGPDTTRPPALMMASRALPTDSTNQVGAYGAEVVRTSSVSCAGKREPGLAYVVVSPEQPVAELFPIEGQSGIEVWHRDGDGIDGQQKLAAHPWP